jgi:anti-sigma-K factor RskA
MDEERFEELAAMNALGMLENDEKRALDGAVARDKEVRSLTLELEQVTAELAYLVKPVEPPANMKRGPVFHAVSSLAALAGRWRPALR